jgi:hypothetical protein
MEREKHSTFTTGSSDALMANCPTKSEYSALDKTSTDPAIVLKIKLYRDNRKLCGMFVYGNNNAVGKAALKPPEVLIIHLESFTSHWNI